MSGTFQYPFNFPVHSQLLLSNFVTSASNSALLHFLQHFKLSPEQLCYIWGGKGCGKSHLLQALCQDNPSAVYLPLQVLLPYGPQVLEGLENYNMLLIDDLHVVAANQEWEEKLFQLFNAVAAKEGRLCFSAAVALKHLPLNLADFHSRLQLCVSFEVEQSDDTDKAIALRLRAQQLGLELKEEVAQYIMLRNSRNMHDLMAVLDKLDTFSLVEQRRLTIPFVKDVMFW